MTTAQRSVTAVGAVLGIVTVLYGAVLLLDLLARSERTTTRPLGTVRALVVDVGSGEVLVRATDGPARLVAEEVDGLLGGPGLTVARRADGAVAVRSDCPWLSPASCGVTASVEVPRGAAVTVRIGSGDVRVRGVGGGVSARTGSGDVELERVAGGRAVVRTGSGSVRASGLAVRRASADTGSGDVDLGFAAPPASVLAETGSGDVTLAVPDVPFRIDASTGSGDQDLDVRQDPRAARRLVLRTGSGDVAVRPR